MHGLRRIWRPAGVSASGIRSGWDGMIVLIRSAPGTPKKLLRCDN
jgi:hypothetical protein